VNHFNLEYQNERWCIPICSGLAASKQDLLPLNTGGRRIFIQSRRPEAIGRTGALENNFHGLDKHADEQSACKSMKRPGPKKFIKSSLNFSSFGVG